MSFPENRRTLRLQAASSHRKRIRAAFFCVVLLFVSRPSPRCAASFALVPSRTTTKPSSPAGGGGIIATKERPTAGGAAKFRPPRRRMAGGDGFGAGGNAPPSSDPPRRRRATSSSSSSSPAEFEFQELRAQLNAMAKSDVKSRNLRPAKRDELESYVRAVATRRPTPVPLTDVDAELPGTRWRLAFSTEGATLGDLPRDADVYVDFAPAGDRLDYELKFSKRTVGLNKIVARSSYAVDSGPVNPGLVTFVYEEIVTDVFGFKGLPVGFFGLLKGRANYIESVYFDGAHWIDRGFSPEGEDYFNVYVKVEREEDGDPWRGEP